DVARLVFWTPQHGPMEQVDRAADRLLLARGHVKRHDADAVRLAQLAEHAVEVGVLAVQARDDDDARRPGLLELAPDQLRAALADESDVADPVGCDCGHVLSPKALYPPWSRTYYSSDVRSLKVVNDQAPKGRRGYQAGRRFHQDDARDHARGARRWGESRG